MMNLSNLFLYLALAAMIFNVVVTMIIISKLSRRGVKINIIFLRLLFPKYVHQYKKMVTQETGRESSLYYIWLVSINLALVLCIVGLLIKFI
jgi:ABC-type transport system involved in cytochrome c biogenesis permease component